jgi:hypothetical protein
LSISDSGKERIVHNRGGRLAARILQALGENTVSEAKEEGLVQLANGLELTYSTVTASYDDRRGVGFKACIDAADGRTPLLSRQVGALILCIDFTGTPAVTYRRSPTSKLVSLPPPKEGVLFCPVSTSLSNASLQCLANGIDVPKGALMWAVARENGTPFEDGWLAKNPPLSIWKGESSSSQRILTLSIHRYS